MQTFRAGGPVEGDFFEYRKTATTKAQQMSEPFEVHTTEGVMQGQAGDYLCLDTAGNPYPCARGVFEASYEPISAGIYE